MAQQHKVSNNNTAIWVDDDGMTNICLHNTVVVKFNDKKVILNSGGWLTSTTKTRMNQASNQFNLGYSVSQKDYGWFVSFGGVTIPFTDRMEVTR